MTALLRILILDPLAFVAATVAAGVIITVVVFGRGSDPEIVAALVGIAAVTTFAVGAFSLAPALVAIVLAEAFGWRSLFYWLAAGGGIGLAADALTGSAGAPAFAGFRLALHLGAGFIGGFVYWLIAGRLAGSGIPRRTTD